MYEVINVNDFFFFFFKDYEIILFLEITIYLLKTMQGRMFCLSIFLNKFRLKIKNNQPFININKKGENHLLLSTTKLHFLHNIKFIFLQSGVSFFKNISLESQKCQNRSQN